MPGHGCHGDTDTPKGELLLALGVLEAAGRESTLGTGPSKWTLCSRRHDERDRTSGRIRTKCRPKDSTSVVQWPIPGVTPKRLCANGTSLIPPHTCHAVFQTQPVEWYTGPSWPGPSCWLSIILPAPHPQSPGPLDRPLFPVLFGSPQRPLPYEDSLFPPPPHTHTSFIPNPHHRLHCITWHCLVHVPAYFT